MSLHELIKSNVLMDQMSLDYKVFRKQQTFEDLNFWRVTSKGKTTDEMACMLFSKG